MIISKKLLLFFAFMAIAFTPTIYTMKLLDTEGLWKEFDLNPYQKNTKKIGAVIFSYDGEFFCGTENYGQKFEEKATLHVWKINDITPKMTRKIRYMFRDYFFSPKGNFLVVKEKNSSDTGPWNIYSLPQCKLITSFSEYSRPCFFPDEKFVFICDNTFGYKIFSINAQSCKEKQTFKDIAKIEFSNVISCKKCMAAIQYNSGTLELFNVKNGCTFETVGFRFESAPIFEFIPNSNFLKITKYSNKTSHNVSTVWNAETKKLVDWDNDVVFSPDRISCVKMDKKNGQLCLFEKINEPGIHIFENVESFNFSQNGTFLGVLSKDKILSVWNIKKQKPSFIAHHVIDVRFLGCDNYMSIQNESFEKKIYRYVSYKNFFEQKNNVKHFFSGQTSKNIEYSDITIFFR